MDRNKVEDVVLALGIPASLKGFDYIADAMELFEEHGYKVSITGFLYPEIAKRNNTTPTSVERNMRHALEVANSARGDYENFEKYIGFTNTTNSAALISLYKHIKRENKEPEKEEGKAEPEPKDISPVLEAAIRRIVKEELKRIVSG